MLRKIAFLLLLLSLAAPAVVAQSSSTLFEQTVDRIAARENEYLKNLQQYSPMVETYIQEIGPDKTLGLVPLTDHYFLGRATFKGSVRDVTFLAEKGDLTSRLIHRFPTQRRSSFIPIGFAQMAVVDAAGIDRAHYDYRFLKREFVGEVRCLLFEVNPKAKSGSGRFVGRIWVEDQDYAIVRVNGTFTGGNLRGRYLHFEAWRLNLQPGLWLPALIYSEESAIKTGFTKNTAFRSLTRIWGYNIGRDLSQEAFTQILVDKSDDVKDQSDTQADLSPLAAERAWVRQAEDNVLERLERSGLLAPAGEVERVLQTVVNNLIITNNLTLARDVRCRIMLTTPIESFTVGHTIVVSRGLLDVLPDEASLAAVLAHELSHLLLGHRLDSKYAFGDRMIFADDRTLQNIAMMRSADEEREADQKSLELLQKSPYKDKLEGVGLFMRQLDQMRPALPKLIRGQMGNSLVIDNKTRLAAVMEEAPKLEPGSIEQLPALPLGGRIKVDSWSGQVEFSKARNVAVLNSREKMPLEVTPVFPYVTRLKLTETPSEAPATADKPATKDKPATADKPALADKPVPAPTKSAGAPAASAPAANTAAKSVP